MRNNRYFDSDLLGRKAYADFLYSIVVNSEIYKRVDESKAYVVAIDSCWGSGKTFFLDMFENYVYGYLSPDCNINNFSQKVKIIRYNAWENDYWQNAFEPLICNIANDIVLYDQQIKEENKRILERIQAASFTVIKGYALTKIKKTYGEEVAELFEKGAEAGLKSVESVFSEYKELRNAVSDLKAALHDYVKVNVNHKLLIIIDELDRCRPSFAIETLEVVKHLFDVEGIVFVFAVDIEQLSSSVRSVYGEGINAYGYLGRFFDYISKMPTVETEEYVEIKLFRSVQWGDKLEGKIRRVVSFVNIWWKAMDFSLRELDTILENIKIMISYFLYKYDDIDAYYMYTFFLMLKYKHLDLFNKLFSYKKCPEEIVDSFEVNHFWKDKFVVLTPFWKNVMIKDLMFDFYAPNEEKEFFTGYFVKMENNVLITLSQDKWEEKYDKRVSSLSHVLYYEDIRKWDEIKNKSIPQYMLERLEVFQFNGVTLADKA